MTGHGKALALLMLVGLGAVGGWQARDGLSREDSEEGLRQALVDARAYVYQVFVVDQDGWMREAGTAWVAGPNVFVTARHVADSFDELEVGERLIVRSPAPQVEDYRVTGVTYHPGYAAHHRLIAGLESEFGPVPVPWTGPNASDVALLHLEKTVDLGPGLPIASDEELRTLSGGDPVGYVGYPSEGGGYFNAWDPVPLIGFGHIVRITDYFGAPSLGTLDTGHLIHTDLPTAGGASGSPLITAQGVVAVLTSGDYIGWVNGYRVRANAGIGYAERANLVRELLDGRAHEAQRARTGEWQAAFQQIYESYEQAAGRR